ENQLFKVARHLFVDASAVISTMFSLPQGNADVVEGSDDEHPLALQDVQSSDFEHLLAVLVAWDQKMSVPPALGQDGWFSVLKLASMWRMHAIRRLAIDELTKLSMSDVDRVVYGKEYAVVDWVMSGYRDLTSRKTVITAEDISKLTVENQLFKVTRRMFEESSEVFSTMFSLPQGDSSPVDGSDDEHPLVLQGIKSVDFENLLKAIVDAGRQAVPKSEAEWLSALKLATMWEMSTIRRTAIKEITQLKGMSDVDQVILGKDYAVVDWVISGYQALTKRNTVVSIEDAARLTLPTCLKVWQAQVSMNPAPEGLRFGEARPEHQILNDIFSSELDEVYQRALALGDRPRLLPPRFSLPVPLSAPPPFGSIAFNRGFAVGS
ncbi:hypothetical protein F5146DRAFT_924703, partial [Armillaria mellea]